MDRQIVTMQGGGAGAASHRQEWFYAGGNGSQPEQAAVVVDGAFLMELLEDAPADQAAPEDVDRLSRVIRSLEAEIGGASAGPPPSAPAADSGESTAEHVPAGDVDGVGLEECMLSDLDSIVGPCVAAEAPFEYWTTTEVSPAVGHEMGGWYVDGDGIVVGYELREQCYYGYSESPHFEHVYSPLWE